METSNSPELAPNATTETASPVESSAQRETTPAAAAPSESHQPASIKDAILSRKGKDAPKSDAPAASAEEVKPEVTPTPVAAAPAAPTYEPNYKFKAFGKEKEIPELFRGLVKDSDTEKQVREVFTRAEAFDDMKGRYENVSTQHQQVLNNFSALDRDVRKVTGFLNKGDLDNFFASVKLSDADILTYLQNKASYMQDPALKAQYTQQVQLRAENLSRQEQFEQMQNNYQTQAVQTRAMQLDMLLSRPDISGVASAWDGKTGEIGAFRNLVIQEAAMYFHTHKQDIPAEQAVQLALQRYGKLVQGAAPQASSPEQSAPSPVTSAPAPQAPPAPVTSAAKPVIPAMNGKGTSPVKQVPKSLDDLKRMGKEAQRAEFMTI